MKLEIETYTIENIYNITMVCKQYIKCQLHFSSRHKLSRDNCKMTYTKARGSKTLVPYIIQKEEEGPHPKYTGRKRGMLVFLSSSVGGRTLESVLCDCPSICCNSSETVCRNFFVFYISIRYGLKMMHLFSKC